MKIKFPKKITIGSTDFLIEIDKDRKDAEFYYYDSEKKTGGKIIIGTYFLTINPKSVLDSIIHELKEIIQEEQSVRYSRADNRDTYEFHYNHALHNDLCSRLAGLLCEFLE